MAEKSGFWSSIPGILTGIAAVITALTGLYAVIGNSSDKPQMTKEEPVNLPDRKPGSTPVIKSANQEQQTTRETQALKVVTAFPKQGLLIDCDLFPTVNTTASLMSWSNYYHKQIIAAKGNKLRAEDPCNKSIDYRGMAHCKEPDNTKIREALLESLKLCRSAGIEWQDIQHSSIIGQ